MPTYQDKRALIAPLLIDALKLGAVIIVDRVLDIWFPDVKNTTKAVLAEVLKGFFAAALIVLFTGLGTGRVLLTTEWRRRRIDIEGPDFYYSFEPEQRSNYVRFNCQVHYGTLWGMLIRKFGWLEGLAVTISYQPAFLTLREEGTTDGASLFGTEQRFVLSTAQEFMEVNFGLDRSRPYDTTTVEVEQVLTLNGRKHWYLPLLVRQIHPVRRVKIEGADQ